ncbi:hypothetical protein ACTFIR_009862 [Dictyostelium discoideum]
MEENIIFDCIVIGAGLSGLKTANLLKNQNINVLVLEAKDKVGGRTDSIEFENYSWDIGGQWVGPTQYRINELIKECNQSIFPQQQKGKKVLEINGKLYRYSSLIPPVGIQYIIEIQIVMWRIDYLANQIKDLKNITQWNKCEYYDSISFQDWINQNIFFETSKKLIEITILAIFSSQPKNLSMLFVLTYFKSSGGVVKAMEVEGGAQQDRVFGSSHNLSKILSKKLLFPSKLTNNCGTFFYGNNGNIKLNSQVFKVEQDYNNNQNQNNQINENNENNLIRISSKNVITNEISYYLCKNLVITVPPNLADSIIYQPELPNERRLITKSMEMGKVIKFIIFYDQCWWRELGFSGEIVNDGNSISFCYDGSFEDGSKPSIIGFFEGSYTDEWSLKSESERKEEAIKIIYKSFNSDQRALTPKHYIDKDWTKNQWSKGGYGCIIGSNKNYHKNNESLRKQIGNIHFAGTETSTEWSGYMEGALESAERVSNEIIPKFIPNYKPLINTHQQQKQQKINQQQQQQKQQKIGFLNSIIIIVSMLTFCFYLIFNLYSNKK